MKDVEEIIKELTSNPETADDGLLINELLQQFQDGVPLEYLRPLLLSSNPQLANSGAWIASELGVQGKPLLDVVASLLGHPDKRVRFWSIDCVLLWAGTFNGRELATTVRLLGDPEKAVRWKAMSFLSRASTQQLASALTWLLKEEPESTDAHGLQWLLGAENDSRAIEAMLVSPEPQMRKYAAAAAARVAAKNQHPLSIASSSHDTEVAEFAADSISLL
jgi:hypothetical protein